MKCNKCNKEIDIIIEKPVQFFNEVNTEVMMKTQPQIEMLNVEPIILCQKCAKLHQNTKRIKELSYTTSGVMRAFIIMQKDHLSYTEMLEMLCLNLIDHLETQKNEIAAMQVRNNSNQ